MTYCDVIFYARRALLLTQQNKGFDQTLSSACESRPRETTTSLVMIESTLDATVYQVHISNGLKNYIQNYVNGNLIINCIDLPDQIHFGSYNIMMKSPLNFNF